MVGPNPNPTPTQDRKRKADTFDPPELPRACACPVAITPEIQTRLARRFNVLVKKLGVGAYGEVNLMQDTDGAQLAVKTSQMNTANVPITRDALREVSALAALRGKDGIVQMMAYSISPRAVRIYMEPAEKTLHELIKENAHTPGWAHSIAGRHVVYQVVRGMAVINGMGIWHRDLKDSNILIMANGRAKITDFGISRGGPFEWVELSSGVYTSWYRPPEVMIARLTGWKPWSTYGVKAEIYSIGAVMWSMLCVDGVKGKSTCAKLQVSSAQYEDDVDERDAEDRSEARQLVNLIHLFGADTFDMCGSYKDVPANTADCKRDLISHLSVALGPAPVQWDSFMRGVMAIEHVDCAATFAARLGDRVPKDAIHLLTQLLWPSPSKRIGYDAICAHSYFDAVRGDYPPLQPQMQSLIDTATPAMPCAIASSSVTMRAYSLVALWMAEVRIATKYAVHTHLLSMHLVRCHLSRDATVDRSMVQLIGVAAILLAVTYMNDEPAYRTDASACAQMTDDTYTAQQVSEYARALFSTGGGMMHVPTSYVFLLAVFRAQRFRPMSVSLPSAAFQHAADALIVLEASPLAWQLSAPKLAQLAFDISDHLPSGRPTQPMSDSKMSSQHRRTLLLFLEHARATNPPVQAFYEMFPHSHA